MHGVRDDTRVGERGQEHDRRRIAALAHAK
jgi:hypothetical protein